MRFLLIFFLFFASQIYAQRDDHMRNFEAIKLWEMAQHLELNEEQIASVIKIHRENLEIISGLHERRSDLIDDLKFEIALSPDDEDLTPIIDEIIGIDKSLQDLREKERERMFEVLTPLQRAKFYVFQVDFARQVRDYLRQNR
ncbi:hypothetical protein JXA84_00330 [candidate division WOR-3 bacterium]|nr:hypothetical protein [candidate division WOR-3 bacterium]